MTQHGKNAEYYVRIMGERGRFFGKNGGRSPRDVFTLQARPTSQSAEREQRQCEPRDTVDLHYTAACYCSRFLPY